MLKAMPGRNLGQKKLCPSLPSYGRQPFRWLSVMRGLADLPLRAHIYIYL